MAEKKKPEKKDDNSRELFKEKLSQFDYVRFTVCDFNGIARSKLMNAEVSHRFSTGTGCFSGEYPQCYCIMNRDFTKICFIPMFLGVSWNDLFGNSLSSAWSKCARKSVAGDFFFFFSNIFIQGITNQLQTVLPWSPVLKKRSIFTICMQNNSFHIIMIYTVIW